MTLAFKVSAQELLDAGAPLTAIRQSYRPHDAYAEQVVATTGSYPAADGSGNATATDAKVVYKSVGSARDNHFYYLAAKDADGNAVTEVSEDSTLEVVWGGSIKDSYVKVTE